jgi:hypothetical protein
LRGLFDTLALFVGTAGKDADAIGQLDRTLTAIDGVLRGARNAAVSWQRLMTGRPPDARELRHFVLTVPVLDFAALEPGARAEALELLLDGVDRVPQLALLNAKRPAHIGRRVRSPVPENSGRRVA